MWQVYARKARNQFWLIGILHDMVATDMSNVTQNLNMQKFPYTFIYLGLMFALECMVKQEKAEEKALCLLK